MKIKSIVADLCEIKSKDRVGYIVDFLRNNNIEHNVQKFIGGINVEVVKQGIIADKEIIFFAHHDIFNDLTEGANDNASSVAVLLAITKHLYFYEPYYTVRIVFNDSEELLGSTFYLNDFTADFDKVLNRVGSFYYLKNLIEIEKVKAVFVLELSGIGDSIYIAQKSGNIFCETQLNEYLKAVAKNKGYKFTEIPISFSDMVSIAYFNLSGTVFGAIPLIESRNYLIALQEQGNLTEIFPHVWKKNHTSMDNYFSIQDRALQMMYEYMVKIIENIKAV